MLLDVNKVLEYSRRRRFPRIYRRIFAYILGCPERIANSCHLWRTKTLNCPAERVSRQEDRQRSMTHCQPNVTERLQLERGLIHTIDLERLFPTVIPDSKAFLWRQHFELSTFRTLSLDAVTPTLQLAGRLVNLSQSRELDAGFSLTVSKHGLTFAARCNA